MSHLSSTDASDLVDLSFFTNSYINRRIASVAGEEELLTRREMRRKTKVGESGELNAMEKSIVAEEGTAGTSADDQSTTSTSRQVAFSPHNQLSEISERPSSLILGTGSVKKKKKKSVGGTKEASISSLSSINGAVGDDNIFPSMSNNNNSSPLDSARNGLSSHRSKRSKSRRATSTASAAGTGETTSSAARSNSVKRSPSFTRSPSAAVLQSHHVSTNSTSSNISSTSEKNHSHHPHHEASSSISSTTSSILPHIQTAHKTNSSISSISSTILPSPPLIVANHEPIGSQHLIPHPPTSAAAAAAVSSTTSSSIISITPKPHQRDRSTVSFSDMIEQPRHYIESVLTLHSYTEPTMKLNTIFASSASSRIASPPQVVSPLLKAVSPTTIAPSSVISITPLQKRALDSGAILNLTTPIPSALPPSALPLTPTSTGKLHLQPLSTPTPLLLTSPPSSNSTSISPSPLASPTSTSSFHHQQHHTPSPPATESPPVSHHNSTITLMTSSLRQHRSPSKRNIQNHAHASSNSTNNSSDTIIINKRSSLPTGVITILSPRPKTSMTASPSPPPAHPPQPHAPLNAGHVLFTANDASLGNLISPRGRMLVNLSQTVNEESEGKVREASMSSSTTSKEDTVPNLFDLTSSYSSRRPQTHNASRASARLMPVDDTTSLLRGKNIVFPDAAVIGPGNAAMVMGVATVGGGAGAGGGQHQHQQQPLESPHRIRKHDWAMAFGSGFDASRSGLHQHSQQQHSHHQSPSLSSSPSSASIAVLTSSVSSKHGGKAMIASLQSLRENPSAVSNSNGMSPPLLGSPTNTNTNSNNTLPSHSPLHSNTLVAKSFAFEQHLPTSQLRTSDVVSTAASGSPPSTSPTQTRPQTTSGVRNMNNMYQGTQSVSNRKAMADFTAALFGSVSNKHVNNVSGTTSVRTRGEKLWNV